MRIALKPILAYQAKYFDYTINNFDIIDRLDPIVQNHYNYYNIFDIQTYSDNSRYLLNLYKINFSRKIFNNFNQNNVNKIIQVIQMDLTFNFDFNFELLSDRYIDIWNNNLDIDYIRPYFYSANIHNNIGYYVFKSLITSYFAKIFNLISSNNILCFKFDNQIILAYLINDEKTNKNLDDILDYFLCAIYDLVNIANAKLDFYLPPEIGLRNMNMVDWYQTKKNKK